MANTFTDCWIKREKENFIRTAKKQITMNTIFVRHLEKLIPIVEKFDGKMLTKRFQTAYKKEMDIPYSFCSLEATKFRIGFQGVEREIHENNEFKGYLKAYTTEVTIEVNGMYQVKGHETLEKIKRNILIIEKESNVLHDSIRNFDLYAEKSAEIEKLINEYKKEVPYTLQFNISLNEPRFFN